MAERPVHCFGVAFFSGRGMTEDHLPAPVPRKPASVEQVFEAAYIRYSRYLDLHDRSDCTIERAIEQATVVRDQRARLPKRIVTAGMSPWKRRALAPFLKGRAGPVLHARGLDKDCSVVIWGEFGRTPKISAQVGRDHWPQVNCALLAGGGMKTGQVIGATDRLGGEAVARPVTFGEVYATLYKNLGIDTGNATIADFTGRPQYLIEDNAQPMSELI